LRTNAQYKQQYIQHKQLFYKLPFIICLVFSVPPQLPRSPQRFAVRDIFRPVRPPLRFAIVTSFVLICSFPKMKTHSQIVFVCLHTLYTCKAKLCTTSGTFCFKIRFLRFCCLCRLGLHVTTSPSSTKLIPINKHYNKTQYIPTFMFANINHIRVHWSSAGFFPRASLKRSLTPCLLTIRTIRSSNQSTAIPEIGFKIKMFFII